jgi:hypothetical protein
VLSDCLKKFALLLNCLFITTLLLLITVLVYSQGVLKGKLIFNRNAAVAKGHQVIIVPSSKDNEQITSDGNFYGNNAQQLQKMGAQTAFTNNEGIYYFKGLPAGRYILKVCIPKGYKYNFVINDNTYTIMDIKDLPATN